MSAQLTRTMATRLLVEQLRDEAVVSTVGQTSRDLFAARDRSRNFYLYGAMGQCSSIGLGLALARPELRVIALDGDGSLLMNLGVLCTIAASGAKNFVLLVWDNELHETTGGQPTATAHGADLAAIARGAGIQNTYLVRTGPEYAEALQRLVSEEGPIVIVAKVAGGPAALLKQDFIAGTRRFLGALAV